MKKIMAFIMMATMLFTACGEKVPVEITADYLPDEYIKQLPSDIPVMEITEFTDEYDIFIRNDDEYSRYVVFSANTAVKDFEFYTIAIPVSDTIEYHKEKPVLHYDNLSEEKSLVIRMNMPETLPWYGISYTDENGETVNFAIHMSGFDGSVILEKFE